nr:hypothetical protein [Tanacetum cinerariifolium]
DDADDKDEEESSDSEEEEEEHQAPTVPALALYTESRRADDSLIGRLRRERRYFRTLSTTYAQEYPTEAAYRARSEGCCTRGWR